MITLTTYKCDICSKVSKSEETMKVHEDKCKASNARKQEMLLRKAFIEKDFRMNLSTFNSEFISKSINEFYKKYYGPGVLIEVDISINDEVSNSHSAPFNGIENFRRVKDLPLNYPGMKGRINIHLETERHYKKFLEIDLFDSSSIQKSDKYSFLPKLNFMHIGNGGGGNSKLSYDFYLFFEDFPILKEEYSIVKAIELLGILD